MAGAEGRNVASVTRLDDTQWRVHGVDHDLAGRAQKRSTRSARASRLPPADELEWLDHHPDTGAPIHGVQVPYWTEVRDMVLHAPGSCRTNRHP